MTDRARNAAFLGARLLMAAALLPTGITRALNVSGFALSLAGAGCPAPNAVATLAVILQVFGPLALVLGVLPRVTGYAMAAFVGVFAALLHPFWAFSGPAAVVERGFLLADLGLSGAFLIYALAGPGAWSWQGWRNGERAVPSTPARKPPARKGGPAKRAGVRNPARAAA